MQYTTRATESTPSLHHLHNLKQNKNRSWLVFPPRFRFPLSFRCVSSTMHCCVASTKLLLRVRRLMWSIQFTYLLVFKLNRTCCSIFAKIEMEKSKKIVRRHITLCISGTHIHCYCTLRVFPFLSVVLPESPFGANSQNNQECRTEQIHRFVKAFPSVFVFVVMLLFCFCLIIVFALNFIKNIWKI